MAGGGRDRAFGDREGLLRAVCECPDDDDPRLRYAEFLEATGDPEDARRAEFIRVQCELARSALFDERWLKLQERKSDLQVNCARWADELPKFENVRWGFIDQRRGFVWEIWCEGAEGFRRHAAAIFASAPIQSASFKRLRTLAPITGVPQLALIKRLILAELALGPADAQALATSPNVSNITDLCLSGKRFGDAGAKALAESPYLRRLNNLDLGHNRIGDEGAIALADSPVVSTLAHFGLAGSLLTHVGALALAKSPNLGQLTGFTLWECKKIGTRGKEALKARFGDAVSFED